MLLSSGFLTFILVTYGLAFLVADSHIWGCNVVRYEEFEAVGELEEASKVGMIPLRPFLLRSKFFRSLFDCYFCMGVWTGAIWHPLLLFAYGDKYWLFHPWTVTHTVVGVSASLCTGAVTCFVTDLVVKKLEQ